MKRVNITIKTSKGSYDTVVDSILTQERVADMVILKYGYALNADFSFMVNGNAIGYRAAGMLNLSENDTVELMEI